MRSSARAAIAAAGAVGVLLSGQAAVQATPPAAGPGAPGAGDPYYPDYGNGGYDVSHYGLKLRYQPETDRLDGVATLKARATQGLTRFNLDFGLSVSKVTVDGRPAKFTAEGAHELVITPPKALRKGGEFTTVVTYGGVPSSVKINGFTSWQRTTTGGVAANEPEVAWWWYPSNDHPRDKATFDVSVTVPDDHQAISNGVSTGVRSKGGWTTYGWRENRPQATYLATLAVGKFDTVKGRTPNGLPYEYAIASDLPAATKADALTSLKRTPEILKWESSLFGRYPFDAVGGTVPNTKAGFAIETQTRPFYSPKFFAKGKPNYSVVVHENAHQWFGDNVSVHDWKDIWLNEGFATYAEWLWADHTGESTAQKEADKVYDAHPAGDAWWDLLPGDPGAKDPFADQVYDRGALAVHAIRLRVGDKAFFKALRTWQARKGGGDATIAQFVRHVEKVSGKNIDDVIKTWLYTAGRPAAAPGH
ncbi:M1 family metallopeptidase [Actinomadura oligospora]|uniref:M1 family metallopeptidase n=1 Tax=Actinomadura oligospora TaxID=111804 RepID=UPI0004AD4545|nr:M1 family metallopeptidase [Actinomadura oligospora]